MSREVCRLGGELHLRFWCTGGDSIKTNQTNDYFLEGAPPEVAGTILTRIKEAL